MKLYDVEIPRLKNEYLLKGKKQCLWKRFFLWFGVMFFGVITTTLLVAIISAYDSLILDDTGPLTFFLLIFFLGFTVLEVVSVFRNKKAILECDAEIEKRLASGELSQQYVDSMFRSKTKEEKKESRITWIFFGTIIAVILFIVVGCTISSNQDDPFDDVFNKNPNNWSDSEKEYVNDLFDWMKENN